MTKRYIELILEFTSRMLYYIEEYKVSFDKAFHYTLNDMKDKLKGYSLRRFYNVARDVVLNYYTLRFLERKIYGSTKGRRRIVKLWTIYFGEKLLNSIKGYKILKKKWQRNLPRHINLHDIRQLDISDIEGLAIKYSYPLWFVQLLAKHLDIAEIRSILESMNREYYWLRVNTLKMDVDKAIKALEKHGVIVEQDKDLWYMLRVLKYSKPLYELELIRKGCVIIQDKGSALVVEALKPQIGDEILDACAAPGVKTSLIMQLTENRSKIIAVDLSRERVKSMVKLLKTFGVKLDNVDIVIADSMKTLLRRKVDKALVDAPCSSSGTVSRDPAVKIHLNDVAWVKRFPIIQKRILSSIITLAYETVYATCSLIPWEGEEVVEEVLSKAPCKLEHLTIIGDPGYQSYHKVCNNVKRLYPHKYQVEGFFIAKLFTQEC